MFMESSSSVAGRFTEDGRAFAASLPCAGITQIRFDGCDLSRPLKGSTPWLTSTLAIRAELGKYLWSSARIAQPTIGAPNKHGRIAPALSKAYPHRLPIDRIRRQGLLTSGADGRPRRCRAACGAIDRAGIFARAGCGRTCAEGAGAAIRHHGRVAFVDRVLREGRRQTQHGGNCRDRCCYLLHLRLPFVAPNKRTPIEKVALDQTWTWQCGSAIATRSKASPSTHKAVPQIRLRKTRLESCQRKRLRQDVGQHADIGRHKL